jgi:vesicle-associated membrane protein 7
MSIEKEFIKMYRPNRIQTANAYSLSNNFSPTVRASIHYHNIHSKELRQDEAVSALLVKVENIRTVMGRNLNMILERGERFENLLTQSETLNQDAQVFKKRSKAARGMMQRRYYFTYAILVFIVGVFLYMTVVSTCGLRLEYCRASSRNNSNENSSSSNSEGDDNAGGN